MLLSVWLLDQFLWLFRGFSLEGYFIFVPIKLWSFLSRRSFFSGSLILRFMIKMFFLFFVLLLNFLLIFRLLIKRTLGVYQVLLDVFFGYVFWHTKLLYRRGKRYNFQQLLKSRYLNYRMQC